MPEVSADGKVFTVTPAARHPLCRGPGLRRPTAANWWPRTMSTAIKRYYDPRWQLERPVPVRVLEAAGPERAASARSLKGAHSRLTTTPKSRASAPLDRYRFHHHPGRSRIHASCTCWRRRRTSAPWRARWWTRYGDDIGAHPVGTGAFRLKPAGVAPRSIELERNPGFRPMHLHRPTGARRAGPGRPRPICAGKRLPLADRVLVDVVEEDQPRWLSFLNGRYHWLQVPGRLPSNWRPPTASWHPYLAKRGIQLHRHDAGRT